MALQPEGDNVSFGTKVRGTCAAGARHATCHAYPTRVTFARDGIFEPYGLHFERDVDANSFGVR